jgi:hypothetical protein
MYPGSLYRIRYVRVCGQQPWTLFDRDAGHERVKSLGHAETYHAHRHISRNERRDIWGRIGAVMKVATACHMAPTDVMRASQVLQVT